MSTDPGPGVPGGEGPADGFCGLAPLVYDDDPMWIPEDPGDTEAAFSSANPWFEGGEAHTWCLPGRARLAVFRPGGCVVDGRPAAFFGYWETRGDPGADAALFDRAAQWAEARGAADLYGPVNFSTYGLYRLRTALEEGGVTFPGEPYNPPRYPALVESLGFRAHQEYNTRVVSMEEARPLFEQLAPTVAALEEEGYGFAPLGPETWMGHLGEFHDLVASIFGDNFAYTPVPFPAFAEMCGPDFIRRADPDASVIARAPGGSLAGFFLCFPHYGPLVVAGAGRKRVPVADLDFATHFPALQAGGRPHVLGKTIGVHPEHRRRNVFPAMWAWAMGRGLGRYDRAYPALSRLDNPTQRMGSNLDTSERRYVLYRRGLTGN